MTVDGDNLRRLADVVDALQETPIDVDSARLLEAGDEAIRGQLTVSVHDDVNLEQIAAVESQDTEPAQSDPEADSTAEGDVDDDDAEVDDADEVQEEDDVVDDDDVEVDDADEDQEEDDECWCERCGYGPSSEIGVKRHHGLKHDGAVSVVTSPPGDTSPEDDQDNANDELSAERVHAELVAMVEDDGYGWVKASDLADRLETTGQKIGHRLGVLRDRGDVEKHNENAAIAVWRPTDADVPEPPVSDEQEQEQEDEDPFVAAAQRNDESGTSTEDDSTELSEAPDVDLEEDAADDDADGPGDDVQDDDDDRKTFPRECHCGATLNGSLELAVHRTEEHGVPQYDLNHLEQGEFEEIVRDADSLQDILDETGWSPEKTLRTLGVYGLQDVVGNDDIELSALNDFEFDGVSSVNETGDDRDDVGDEPTESDSAPEQRVANDGGAVAFSDYSASSGNGTECQNCGSHVDKQFAKVFEPEREGAPRCCPNCEDLTRNGDGTIRKKRHTKRGDT